MQHLKSYQSRLPAPRGDECLFGLGLVEAFLWVLIAVGVVVIIRMAAALSVDLAGVVAQAQAMGGM